MKKLYLLGIISLLVIVLVACGGGNGAAVEPAADTSDAAVAPAADNAQGNAGIIAEPESEVQSAAPTVEEPAAAGAEEEASVADAATEMESAAEVTRPAWHSLPFTDVRTGQTLTFADLAGKTVYVEPMATWCTNCRRQLGNVAEAQAQLDGNENIVFVALSVEPNMDDARLLEYTQAQGFNWAFAKASPELLQGLVDSFGRTVTNPPSTPHFTIWPDGSMTELSTGYESAADLVSNLQG